MNSKVIEKEVLRMELQIGELIRIVANINERLKTIEDSNHSRTFVQQIPLAHKSNRKSLRV